MQAEEIVAGSFRNIAGSVVSTDAAANTLTVTDFKTKKPVVIHLNADSQLHKLDPTMAQAIAARLKPASSNHEGAPQGKAAHGGEAPHAPAPAMPTAAPQPGAVRSLQRLGWASRWECHADAATRSRHSTGGPASWRCVMIVATQVAPGSLTACTLLAGVEPILNASPSADRICSRLREPGGQGGGGGGGGDASGGQQ